jgi:hypothetical protein
MAAGYSYGNAVGRGDERDADARCTLSRSTTAPHLWHLAAGGYIGLVFRSGRQYLVDQVGSSVEWVPVTGLYFWTSGLSWIEHV